MHMQSCLRKNPFLTLCQKFSVASSFKMHMKTHGGKMLFSYTVCYIFLILSNLKK